MPMFMGYPLIDNRGSSGPYQRRISVVENRSHYRPDVLAIEFDGYLLVPVFRPRKVVETCVYVDNIRRPVEYPRSNVLQNKPAVAAVRYWLSEAVPDFTSGTFIWAAVAARL